MKIFNINIAIGFNKVKKIDYWGENGNRFSAIMLDSNKRLFKRLLYLFSIVKGDMSFVGSLLTSVKETNPNSICKPGITGLAKMRKSKFNQADRSALDHYYVQNQSLTLDIEIILKSIFGN